MEWNAIDFDRYYPGYEFQKIFVHVLVLVSVIVLVPYGCIEIEIEIEIEKESKLKNQVSLRFPVC